jgi:hypothetical protein
MGSDAAFAGAQGLTRNARQVKGAARIPSPRLRREG